MKKNTLLKGALALALGTALVAPTAQKVYAEEQAPAAVTESVMTEYDAAVKSLQDKVNESYEIKKTPKYINASSNEKYDFDLYLTRAESKLKEAKPTTDENAKNAIAELNNLKEYLNKRALALDGQSVHEDYLYELTNNGAVSLYKKSEAYLHATAEQQKAYEKAITEGKALLGRTDVSNSEFYDKVKSIENAKEAIEEAYSRPQVMADLKAELDMYKNIKKADYTESSYKVYNAQYVTAHSLYENGSKQDIAALVSATDALKEARLALVKATTPEDEKNAERLKRLKEAVENNKTTIRAAELLIELAPEKVKDVRTELDRLIKEAKERNETAQKYIDQLEGKRG